VPVTLGDQSFEVELTLANRDTMEFRMLLGREALNNRYIVNPAENCIVKEYTDAEITKKYATYFKEKTGLKIAILASNPELYSNKRLMEAGENARS